MGTRRNPLSPELEARWQEYGRAWGRRLRRMDKLPIDAPMTSSSAPGNMERPPVKEAIVCSFEEGLWIGYMEGKG